MLWAQTLLLAFLAPASQTASNLEWRERSVTKQAGKFATISCDIDKQSSDYVHWYLHKDREAPKRILYYALSTSKFWEESGIKKGKYLAYQITGSSCKFVINALEESDSGVYYCAGWDMHHDSDFPYPKLKTACGCQEQPCTKRD